jgi:hypothetical protein
LVDERVLPRALEIRPTLVTGERDAVAVTHRDSVAVHVLAVQRRDVGASVSSHAIHLDRSGP